MSSTNNTTKDRSQNYSAESERFVDFCTRPRSENKQTKILSSGMGYTYTYYYFLNTNFRNSIAKFLNSIFFVTDPILKGQGEKGFIGPPVLLWNMNLLQGVHKKTNIRVLCSFCLISPATINLQSCGIF